MASFNIHFAIAKRYLEKNKIESEKEFYDGTVGPDLAPDNKKTHYTRYEDKEDLHRHLKEKIDLHAYLKDHSIRSDYAKGEFLHLITDYLFFNDFFDEDYLNNISYGDFCKDLYYSYELTNGYLDEKYSLDYGDYLEQIQKDIAQSKKDKNITPEKRSNILEYAKLDAFIEKVASIDLEKYKDKILANGENILP